MEVGAAGPAWRALEPDERRAWAAAIAPQVVVDRVLEASTVNGPCPTCGHEFSTVLTDDEMLGEVDARLRSMVARTGEDGRVDWGGRLRFLAACRCDGDHTGAPRRSVTAARPRWARWRPGGSRACGAC